MSNDFENEITNLLDLDSQTLIYDIQKIDSDAAAQLAELLVKNSRGEIEELQPIILDNIINPESIEAFAYSTFGRWPRWLNLAEWIRNIIVLIPITLTWLELSKASKNYSQVINLRKELITEPFLLLWERHFYNLGNPGLSFSQLALLDFILLSIVVVITVFVHWWRDMIETKAEKNALSLRQRLEKSLRILEEKIAPARYQRGGTQDPGQLKNVLERFNSHLESLLALAKQDANWIEALAMMKRDELVATKEFTDVFQDGAEKLNQHAQSITPIYRDINTALSNFLDEFHQSIGQQGKLGISLQSMSQDILSTSTSIQNIGIDVKSVLENNAVSIEAIGAERRAAQELLNNIGNLIQQLVNADSALRDGLSRVEYSNDQAAKAINAFDDRVGSLATTMKHLQGTTSKIYQQINSSIEAANKFFEKTLSGALKANSELHDSTLKALEKVQSIDGSVERLQRAINEMSKKINQTSGFTRPASLSPLVVILLIGNTFVTV